MLSNLTFLIRPSSSGNFKVPEFELMHSSHSWHEFNISGHESIPSFGMFASGAHLASNVYLKNLPVISLKITVAYPDFVTLQLPLIVLKTSLGRFIHLDIREQSVTTLTLAPVSTMSDFVLGSAP